LKKTTNFDDHDYRKGSTVDYPVYNKLTARQQLGFYMYYKQQHQHLIVYPLLYHLWGLFVCLY